MNNGYPFMYPGMYSPGQMAFNNNPEMSQLVSMFAGPLLGQMAGPGNFVPHMMPGQALMDQFAMRNYQNQTRTASFNLAAAGPQNQDVANRLLGIRSAFTGSAPTDMNREQAMNMAQMLNNPMTKTFAGMLMGPENVEMLLHGSRGDVQSLGNTVNKLGYFQKDPSGGARMDANSLEDLTTGVFSHLYEPQGNTEQLAATARAGGAAGQAAQQRLQKAANMEHHTVVSDADVQARLERTGSTRVDDLYKKYVQGGTATDTATQAKELTKFDRAIKESRVLLGDEATISQVETAAFKQPTAEMRGLTAGQAGQLMENLFQRGVLPPTIGNLDAKGRVNAIAETKLDDATLQRLAETMARRQLTEKNEVGAGGKKFSEMTETQQRQEIEKLANQKDGTKDQISATRQEAIKAAGGQSDKSAEEIMQMTGGEALAGNVDASRVSSRLKDYADSIAAVRDIFGDNGNPNAPMPALMAALDHLTQGGMGQINPNQMSTTLRQMQSMARETGTGMEQLAAMSAQAGAIGQMRGIAPSITMQNVASSMGLTKTAMERGVFSNNTPGGMTKAQFQEEAITRLQQGDASDNAKAMAAMRRIYLADPEKFKGTELEAAVTQGYEDGASGGKYTYKGEERNLFEEIGRFGTKGAQRIITQSGGDVNDLMARFRDSRTTSPEFLIANRGFMTQKHQILRDLSAFGAGATATNALSGTQLGQELGQGGIHGVGNVLAEMVLDSSDRGVQDQIDFLQKNMPQKLTEHLQKTEGMGEKDAQAMAERIIGQTFGRDKKGNIDASGLDRLVGHVGTVAQHRYGRSLVDLQMFYGNQGDVEGMKEMARSAAHAEATKRLVGAGSESTPTARMSDYFRDIGKRGEKFNIDSFVQELSPFVADKDILRRYAGEQGATMHSLYAMRDEVSVTDKTIDDLAAAGNVDELKKLAGYKKDDKVEVVSDATLKTARDEKIKGMDEKAATAAYADALGITEKEAALVPLADKKRVLAESEKYAHTANKDYLSEQSKKTGTQAISMGTLKTNAARAIGQVLDGVDKSGRSNAEVQSDIDTVLRSVHDGTNKDFRTASVGAISRLFQGAEGKAGELAKNQNLLTKLIEGDGAKSTAEALKTLGLSKEDFEAGKALEYSRKSDKQKMAEAVIGVGRADEMQQFGKATDANAVQAGENKQKADKVELAAQNVYINGAKAGGSEQLPAATPQKPGSPMPATKEGIDAEIAAINKKEGHLLWDKITPEDKQRREELIKQRETLAAEEKKAAISAVGRLFADDGGKAGALAKDANQLKTLMSADGEAGTDAILKQLGLTKEEFEKNKSLAANKKSAEQKMAEVMTAVQRSDEQQQLDKVTDEKTAQNVAQKTDKVELDAQNVYINGAKAGGGSEQLPNATPQAPGSPMPASKDAIDAEIAAINKKEGHLLWDKITPEDKQRREELIKQRETLAAEEKKAASDAPAQTPAPQADKPLPEAKTADKDPATAESVRQQTDAAAVKTTGASPEEAKSVTQRAEATSPAVQAATDKANQAKTEAAAAAEKSQELYGKLTPAEKAEVDYANQIETMRRLRETANNKDLSDKERSSARSDLRDLQEMPDITPEEVAAKRIGEELGMDMSGNLSVKTGSDGTVNINGTQLDAENAKKFYKDLHGLRQAAGPDAGDPLSSNSRDYVLAETEAKEKALLAKSAEKERVQAINDDKLQQQAGADPYTRDTSVNASGRSMLSPAPTPPANIYEQWKQIKNTGLTATPPDVIDHTAHTGGRQAGDQTGARPPARIDALMKDYSATGGNRLQQHLIAEQIEQEMAAGLPPEKTAGVQQTPGQLASANIHPAAANPQQVVSAGDTAGSSTPASGGGDSGSITLNGSLRLEGLHEAILDATANKSVATPGGGVPVIPGKASGLGGMPSGRHNHTA